jgi:hypothetical protein
MDRYFLKLKMVNLFYFFNGKGISIHSFILEFIYKKIFSQNSNYAINVFFKYKKLASASRFAVEENYFFIKK